MDNILDAIEDGQNSKRLKDRLQKYEMQEQAIMDALENAKKLKETELTRERIIKYFHDFTGKLDDLKQRKKLLDLLVDRIYVYDDEVVVTYFSSSDKRRLNINDTMEMINARKKVIDMMEEYNSSSDFSLEEKLKSVGLDGKEDPPDFF